MNRPRQASGTTVDKVVSAPVNTPEALNPEIAQSAMSKIHQNWVAKDQWQCKTEREWVGLNWMYFCDLACQDRPTTLSWEKSVDFLPKV